MEIWRDIEGFEGIYQISSQGRVKSLKRIDNNNHPIKEKILKPNIDNREGKGCLRVRLCKNGKQKFFQIHRLVYETFVGKIPDDMQCNHINEKKDDNRLENLNLMTPKENSNWGTRNERIANSVMELLKNRDGLALGICNGFQALIKLGLVPYGEIVDIKEDMATLTYNNINNI